jgi:hypothetical protein
VKTSKLLIPILLTAVLAIAVSTLRAQQTTIETPGEINAGGSVSLHVNVDHPLPEGATIRVEVSPQSATQWIALSTAEPADRGRTSFTLKGKLPENAVPGTWIVRNVWLFLPGSNQGQSLAQNNASFQVKGKQFPIPSKAEVTVTK